MTNTVRQSELKDLGAVLVERKVISATQKAEAERQAQQRRVPMIDILQEQNLVQDEDVAKARSVVFQVPYVELQGKIPT